MGCRAVRNVGILEALGERRDIRAGFFPSVPFTSNEMRVSLELPKYRGRPSARSPGGSLPRLPRHRQSVAPFCWVQPVIDAQESAGELNFARAKPLCNAHRVAHQGESFASLPDGQLYLALVKLGHCPLDGRLRRAL